MGPRVIWESLDILVQLPFKCGDMCSVRSGGIIKLSEVSRDGVIQFGTNAVEGKTPIPPIVAWLKRKVLTPPVVYLEPGVRNQAEFDLVHVDNGVAVTASLKTV